MRAWWHMAVFLAEGRASARAQNRKNNIAFTELKQSSVAGMEKGKCFKMKQERLPQKLGHGGHSRPCSDFILQPKNSGEPLKSFKNYMMKSTFWKDRSWQTEECIGRRGTWMSGGQLNRQLQWPKADGRFQLGWWIRKHRSKWTQETFWK